MELDLTDGHTCGQPITQQNVGIRGNPDVIRVLECQDTLDSCTARNIPSVCCHCRAERIESVRVIITANAMEHESLRNAK